ncbi:MAG TPA: hypothetical protein VF163_17505 [Micromonosporaceae bacterium]
MSSPVLDPKLKEFASQIETALQGGPMPKGYESGGYGGVTTDISATVRDGSMLAGSFLQAYHNAALVNPTKAIRPTKGIRPRMQLSSPEEATSKDLWDTFWNVVEHAGPPLLEALTKDYRPETPNLASIIQAVPAHRRNDKGWVDFATDLLLTVAQGTVQSLAGQKDFTDPRNRPQIPQPPANADKNFLSDAFDFVQEAAPVAMPIILSLL